MIDILKKKLARGGHMNGGEIKLVVSDIINLYEAQMEKINELEERLDALARRSDSRSKKSSPKPEVQPDSDQ